MSLVWFILLIGGLITVHELGHLLAARLLDVKVLKVSIGFGPALASVQRGDTRYQLSAVPLGGYVRLLGEDRRDTIRPADRRRAFQHKPAWQRLVIIMAGPAANLICPVVLFVHLYARQTAATSATLGTVFVGEPAGDAGLRAGDRVVAIDGEPVRYWDEFNERVTASPGQALRISVERPGEARPLTKYVTPRVHLRTDALGRRRQVGIIGVAPHFRLPQIGVEEGSAAYKAGLRSFDLVTSIQGRAVETADDLRPLVHPRSGGVQVVSYLRPQPSAFGFADLARLEPRSAEVVPTAIARVGRSPRFDCGIRPADLFVRAVEPNTPAAQLGIHAGDQLTTLDGVSLTAWELFAEALEEHPRAQHTIGWRAATAPTVERFGTFHLERRDTLDEYSAEQTLFVFGAEGARATAPVPELPLDRPFIAAVGEGIERALGVTGVLMRVVGLTLIGHLPASAIGGPILIYEVAGVAAAHGLDQFLVMAALVSLNLGLLNLLPVPLLDGGQAALVILEAAFRRPVSARARERATWLGLALLAALLLLASRNDIVHLFAR